MYVVVLTTDVIRNVIEEEKHTCTTQTIDGSRIQLFHFAIQLNQHRLHRHQMILDPNENVLFNASINLLTNIDHRRISFVYLVNKYMYRR